MRLALLVLAWVSGSIAVLLLIGWRWSRTGLGRKYPGEDRYEPTLAEFCSCPLALNAARILNDFEYACINQADDGEDGLCSSCRAQCLRIVEVARRHG